MKMNPEIKARWVAALRSGEYIQGRWRLRNNRDQFCCLGVLCNIHAQDHPEIAATQTSPTSYMDRGALLPSEVMLWAGLPDISWVVIGGHWQTLARHNDGGRTFEQIARAIEEQL